MSSDKNRRQVKARLPKPGDDHGDWGDILNNFLATSHDDDGTLKSATVGTDQLQDAAITLDKLDPSVQATLASVVTVAQPDAASLASNVVAPLAAAVTVGSVPYYAPEDYGCNLVADAPTNDAAIAAAIQAASADNGVVQFRGSGPYNVSQAIDQDVSLFVVRGNKTILTVVSTFTGSYFWSIFSSAEYPYGNNQGVALSSMIIRGTVINTPPLAATAIQIGHATYINNSLFSIENVYLQGFATGFKYIQNAWRVKVANSRVTGSTAISVAPGLANFGENMLVENCMFESWNPLVTIGTGEWNFINCSFNSTLITLNGNCTVKLSGCHLEPHTVYPCATITHSQAMLTLDNTMLIIDPAVVINSAAFNVVNTNTTYGLIIRNLSMIQSANYTPQVNSQDCLLVSGGGRVDMLGFSSNTNGYGFAIATSNNLIYNGDADKGTTAGWTTYASYGGPSTFTADASQHKSGTYSLKLTTSASSIYIGQAVPCRAGQWVFAQCWNKINVDSGTGNTFISIDFLSAKNEVIQTIGYTNTIGTTWWTCRRGLTGSSPVAPAGTGSARVYIGVVGSGSTTAWYDDIILNVA